MCRLSPTGRWGRPRSDLRRQLIEPRSKARAEGAGYGGRPMQTLERPLNMKAADWAGNYEEICLEARYRDFEAAPEVQAQPSQIANLDAVKAAQKATWEAGDFGQVAQTIVSTAAEFMRRQALRPGLQVLDAACGTGNLAVLAARKGCVVSGVDIASNLIAQACDLSLIHI